MPTSCADSRLPAWSDRLRRALLGLLVASATTAARASVVPERLSVEPAEIRLDGGDARQQVAVTGHFADGSVRDLTAEARFAVEPAGVADGLDGRRGHARRRTARARLRVEAGGQAAEVADPGRRGRPGAAGRATGSTWSRCCRRPGCNMGACHGNLNGKGGFRLSLRGDDPAFDLASLTRDALGRRVDRHRPGAEPDRPQADRPGPARGGPAVRRRLARGRDAARLDRRRGHGRRPRPRRGWSGSTSSPPSGSSPRPALAQQLVVTAEFADGIAPRRDPAGGLRRQRPDPGRGHARRPGRGQRAGRGRPSPSATWTAGAISRLAFLADRPDFAWDGPAPAQRRSTRTSSPSSRRSRSTPPPPADDAVFLRRAYLDAIGRAADPRRGPGVPGRPRPRRSERGSSTGCSTGPSSPTSGP